MIVLSIQHSSCESLVHAQRSRKHDRDRHRRCFACREPASQDGGSAGKLAAPTRGYIRKRADGRPHRGFTPHNRPHPPPRPPPPRPPPPPPPRPPPPPQRPRQPRRNTSSSRRGRSTRRTSFGIHPTCPRRSLAPSRRPSRSP